MNRLSGLSATASSLLAKKPFAYLIQSFVLLFVCGLISVAQADAFNQVVANSQDPAMAVSPESNSIATNDIASPRTALLPAKNDGLVAYTVAELLEQHHFLHLPFDAELSSKFLDLYINTYDPQHLQFLQSDIDEFDKYRTILGELTKEKRDTSPAYVIFDRFMQRMEERSAYAREALTNTDFEFTGNDHILMSRKTAPFPKDMAEAHALWKERLRYEYLQEKLGRETPKELAATIGGKHGLIPLALTSDDLHRDIVKVVDLRYRRILRNFHEWESDKVLETYLTALARVYDPHSDYEGRDTLANFSIQMSLSLFGIGAVLMSDDDGYCNIVSLSPGMPAAKTKMLHPKDRIVAVAQGTNAPVDCIQMPLNKVVDMIRGPKGTTVRLTIIPVDASDPSKREVVSVVRDEIKLEDQQAKAKLIEFPAGAGQTQRLGVIDLPSFYASFAPMGARSRAEVKSATVDVNRLLTKLKNEHVDGVILDLRHNGGGSLSEAIDLTGLFIKQGPVVQVASSDHTVQVDEDNDPRIQYDGPLVVLTSRFSASASEIVAGALQDYGRAVVVGGASTHGKGTVQTITYLAPYLFMNGEFLTTNIAGFGAVKYTTNKFYRVTGSSTQLKGVASDIVLPESYDYMETEEATEEYAMKWDEIEKTDFEKLNRVKPYLEKLEKKSAARVKESRDFDYVREDIVLVKKAMAEKSVSLNEAQRLKEVEEVETRRKNRDAELKLRKPSDAKVFNLNLKNGEVLMVEQKKAVTNSVAAVAPNGDSNATNSPAASAEALAEKLEADDTTGAAASENTDPEEKAPLDEAEHILSDYIGLLRANDGLTADHAAK